MEIKNTTGLILKRIKEFLRQHMIVEIMFVFFTVCIVSEWFQVESMTYYGYSLLITLVTIYLCNKKQYSILLNNHSKVLVLSLFLLMITASMLYFYMLTYAEVPALISIFAGTGFLGFMIGLINLFLKNRLHNQIGESTLIQSFLKNSLILSMIFFMFLIIVFSFITTFQILDGKLLFLIFAVFLILLFIINTKVKVNDSVILLGLFLLAFILRTGYILAVDIDQVSDFKVMLDGAVMLSKGDLTFTKWPYYLKWAYQLGFTSYQAIILYLTDGSVMALKLMNSLLSSGTCLFIYGIVKMLSGKRAATIAGAIYAFNIPAIAMCPILTNQHLAVFLFVSSFYFFLKYSENMIKGAIFAGVLVGTGNIIRPMGVIIVLTMIIFRFFTTDMKKKGELKKSSMALIAFIAIYFAIQLSASVIFIGSGLSDTGLSNQDPYWKLVVGLNIETGGRYSQDDLTAINQISDQAERESYEKNLIIKRISDPFKLIGLFSEKTRYLWGDIDETINWSLNEAKSGSRIFSYVSKSSLEQFLKYSGKATDTILYIFMLITLVYSVFHKDIYQKRNILLFIILFFVFFAIHLLVEIQFRYRMFIMPYVIIIAVHGGRIMNRSYQLHKSNRLHRKSSVS
ncbi:MAG: glycosyltransferase family 39 protein [Clostridia bacterium]|nr:glycosyltransferase family 39 protein [Clostridia bacterium]